MNNKEKQNSKSLAFTDLNLETVVAEVRYPFAFLMWDFAGQLWQQIENELPRHSFIVDNASPGSVKVTYAGQYELLLETSRFAVSCMHLKVNFDEYLDVLKTVYSVVTERLQIEVFDRIGLRQIFVQKFDTIEKASKALNNLPCVRLPEGITDDKTRKIVSPGLTFRVEDDSNGVLYNLHTATRNLEIGVPPALAGDEADKFSGRWTQSLIAFDIDVYTKTPVTIGQLSIRDWVRQAASTARTNGEKFFK